MAAELIYPNFLIWMENFHNLCWGSPDHGRSIVLGNWTIYFGFGPFIGGVVTKQDTSTDDRAAGPGKLRENRPLVGKMSLVGVKASICLWGATAVTSPITTRTSPINREHYSLHRKIIHPLHSNAIWFLSIWLTALLTEVRWKSNMPFYLSNSPDLVPGSPVLNAHKGWCSQFLLLLYIIINSSFNCLKSA